VLIRTALVLAVACNSSRPDYTPTERGSSHVATATADATSSAGKPDPWAAGPDAGSGSAKPERFDIAPLAKVAVADAAGHTAPIGDRFRDVNLLAFWASWCKPCIEELPKLDKLYATQRGRARVSMIAVNLDDEEHHAEAIAAIARLHIAMPVVFDPDATTYDVLYPGPMVVIPAVAVVTKEGGSDRRGGPADESADALIARYRARIDSGLAGKLGVLP
jgi:thiol-disulfide isomerase/thioredoxin